MNIVNLKNKLDQINQLRFNLRAELINKMKISPTMQDSETLRLVENDISFWVNQTDHSVSGLLSTLNKSLQ